MGISDSSYPGFQQFNSSIQNKTLIVDRDNTLIADQVHQIDINKLLFLPGVLENLRKISSMSVNIVIATNQGGVALGKFSEKNLRVFHDEINRILITNDILLFGVIYCLHHENAIEDKDKNCECRKPKPGMLKRVIELTNCSQDRTAMIGDSWRDKHAAAAIKIPYFDANFPEGWVSATEWAEKK
jgi:D,D-heptose 1,7-bisphosphate phosphatase